MELPEKHRRRVCREKQLSNRLQLATTRLEATQQERIWAIAAASEAGLSIRNIVVTTGLSSSRVRQLLSDEEGVCSRNGKNRTLRICLKIHLTI
jgi:hypothetical protein